MPTALVVKIKTMGAHLFGPFSKMIDEVPAAAVVAIAERQRLVLAEDLACGRTGLAGEARSILSFCRFLNAARAGSKICPVGLPMADTAFYRKTTERLVAAGELPPNARDQFDQIFSVPALKLLTSSP
jgi:hypothetical protein